MANWDIVRRAMEILETEFTKKLNDEAWEVLSGAMFKSVSDVFPRISIKQAENDKYFIVKETEESGWYSEYLHRDLKWHSSMMTEGKWDEYQYFDTKEEAELVLQKYMDSGWKERLTTLYVSQEVFNDLANGNWSDVPSDKAEKINENHSANNYNR